ncbi:DHH family phosphoesterase [Candidatus Contubernalis alkaliaceticus]|uniref:DHH family phosphoesterase n=1 Tax=Candidatus Contubernalis alkaliaceticus TaxID=338645 RepID=UPI001F4BE1AD|nr:bifunctional oligoribonuclease/PAP phosphatase NrnA [Candidatus Contubernalis alkalaceticus]UNC91839.1 bifunctional oligoribonuclease/PAP phosphatase NrnA [Candidatus Contubernalis alkalaceticus]
MISASLETISKLLLEEDNFLIASHMSPDGDSVGSALALWMALQALGKTTEVTTVDPVPFKYRFLPCWEQVKVWQEVKSKAYGLFIILDSSDLRRIEPLLSLAQSQKILNIDHHITNERYGMYNHIDSQAGSVGEIIFEIIKQMKVQISKEMAVCLYTALNTDTGSFRYANTTSRTHRIAGALIDLGVKPAEITRYIYENVTREGTLLIKEALNTLHFECQGQIAHITVTREMMERTGARDEDTEGLVNYTRNIGGVEIGIIFKEICAEKVRVGFRSHGVDVSKLAEIYGGGGHPRAAGCQLEKSISQARPEVIKSAGKFLEECKNPVNG